MSKYSVPDQDLGISYQDVPPWRSYEVSDCNGDSFDDMLENAMIHEIDQDGGNLNSYPLDEACEEVCKAVETLCAEEVRLTDLARSPQLSVTPKLED